MSAAGTATGRRRAVFLDVDGTFADRGHVPPGHVAAVRAARAAGNLVFLCTGRPKSMLPPAILEAGFDGLVCSAGGYVEVRDDVVADRRIPPELAQRVIAVLDEHDVAYILEAPRTLYGRPGVDERLRALLSDHLTGGAQDAPSDLASDEHDAPVDILAMLEMTEDLSDASFSKVTYFDSPVAGSVLADAIGDGIGVLPSSIPGMGVSAGELYLAGIHKALGIELVTSHLGLDRADTVAFGDGANDLEMVSYAGVGVAIEGSSPELLAAADRTARGPRHEGLAVAFAELGLV
jgi:Cof subfamily protein (haloacid dehalogenase superfamily)